MTRMHLFVAFVIGMAAVSALYPIVGVSWTLVLGAGVLVILSVGAAYLDKTEG